MLEQITKKEFDKIFKELITETEQNLKDYMAIYQSLLDFRANYRTAFKYNRIQHLLEDGVLKYIIQEKRNVGFEYDKDN